MPRAHTKATLKHRMAVMIAEKNETNNHDSNSQSPIKPSSRPAAPYVPIHTECGRIEFPFPGAGSKRKTKKGAVAPPHFLRATE